MDNCFFRNCVQLASKPLITVGADRIRSIISASKARQDDLSADLERRLQSDDQLTIMCHKDCVSTYTSKTHIQRKVKLINEPTCIEQPSKRLRRCEVPSFDFNQHCLFCGEECTLQMDIKHPDRWRRAFICRTADRGDQITFKQAVLDVCNARQDDYSEQVKIRIMGAVSDLHAANARYHDDCRMNFMSQRSVNAASRSTNMVVLDPALDAAVMMMKSDMTRIWNSSEVLDFYLSSGGTALSRRSLLTKLSEIIGPDLLILSGQGVASIIIFRHKASSALHLLASDEDNSDEVAISNMAKKIGDESKRVKRDDKKYKTRIDMNSALEAVSPTLRNLLSKISKKLDDTPAAALIGNIVTSIIGKAPTTLQIALSVLLSRKTLIEDMYQYRVCCSYDEYLLFKASVAKAANILPDLRGIVNAEKGLVQVVSDNFDSNISSQNGILSTHSLAVLLTVNEDESHASADDSNVRRLTREEAKQPVAKDVEVHRYQGPRKPSMPADKAKRGVLPLRISASQVLHVARCHALDYDFLRQIIANDNVPEFAGFNTKFIRQQGLPLQPSTRAIYTPLIDMNPADPDTMLTAMEEAKRLTKQCGQEITIFTNDQQLYKVAVDITWVYPERFADLIPRLGGMHMLMSYIGCVGVLMADSGLEEIMKSSFGSVPKMLSGKMFPQNFRALRLVVEEVLRPLILQAQSHNELMQIVGHAASLSPTAQLWLENLVIPVFLMMAFVRAEREGDWSLHLWAVQEMLPYFFSAGHHNYARYGLYYLRSMERLDGDVLRRFMNGEHVMRHKKGFWNGIWSDMFIESTFMRYGHGPHGIVGVTMKAETVKKWAYSLHVCSRILQDLSEITNVNNVSAATCHKEEKPSRIKSDAIDRTNIRTKLESCVDPFNTTDVPKGIVNIVTGRIASDNVNVNDALKIGKAQMKKYADSWPDGFNKTIKKEVVNLAASRKSIKVGSTEVCDATLIYSRVLGLQASREVNFNEVLKHELAPIPTSMFDDRGEMRIAKSKATLIKILKTETSARLISPPDAIVVDGSAVLWVVHWPNKGTVNDYISNFCKFIREKCMQSDVYLIFDRYEDFSIKSGTRLARAGQHASRRHKLSLSTPLPPQQVVLTVTENKVQLTELICQQLTSTMLEKPASHKLVVTGKDLVPIELSNGAQYNRTDLQTTHEEADVIIINQVIKLARHDAKSISVICDDTDVFILLMYAFLSHHLSCIVTMEGTSAARTLIDIGASAANHCSIVAQLPAVHAITGCDTVAQCFGIGKGKAIKCVKNGYCVHKLGDITADIEDVISEATVFMAACYGSNKKGSMSDVRIDIWSTKMGRQSVTTAPALKNLPPTTEAFRMNVLRAHVQTAIWKSATEADPPALDPTLFGWKREEASRCLVPVLVPAYVNMAPSYILEMIRCGCSSERPCLTSQCRCTAAKLPCTIFCTCRGDVICRNETNRTVQSLDDDDCDNEYLVL